MVARESLSRNPAVCHVTHTLGSGGAELALQRSLKANPDWDAMLALPAGGEQGGGFAGLGSAQSTFRSSSRPGAASAGVGSAVRFGLEIILSGISLAKAPTFRRADVVHANTTRAAVISGIACRLRRKPLVVHLRDEVSPDSLGRLGFEALRLLALRRSNAVVANSSYTLSSAMPFLPSTCSRFVIPSPIGSIRQSPSRPNGTVTFGMLARIDSWKGHELLIRSFAQAFSEDDDVMLELAGAPQFGEDHLLDLLQGLARELGITHRVKFLGHVDDVQGFFDGLDVAVQCSTRPEPLGQNVLQYLAAGLAVVVANQGGPTEWVDHDVNGLVFQAGDSQSLAANLRLLHDRPHDRDRLRLAARSTSGLPSDTHVNSLLHRAFQSCARGTSREDTE